MKLNQTSIVTASGSVMTSGVELQSMAKVYIMRHLGLTELGKMDSYKLEYVHGEPVVTVTVAQEKPWTYIIHVFTLAFQRDI